MPFSFLPRMIYPHLTDVRAEDLTARGFLLFDTTQRPIPEACMAPSHAAISGVGSLVV